MAARTVLSFLTTVATVNVTTSGTISTARATRRIVTAVTAGPSAQDVSGARDTHCDLKADSFTRSGCAYRNVYDLFNDYDQDSEHNGRQDSASGSGDCEYPGLGANSRSDGPAGESCWHCWGRKLGFNRIADSTFSRFIGVLLVWSEHPKLQSAITAQRSAGTGKDSENDGEVFGYRRSRLYWQSPD